MYAASWRPPIGLAAQHATPEGPSPDSQSAENALGVETLATVSHAQREPRSASNSRTRRRRRGEDRGNGRAANRITRGRAPLAWSRAMCGRVPVGRCRGGHADRYR